MYVRWLEFLLAEPEVSSSSLRNAAVLCGRALPPLWSIPARMGISLGEVWLKGAFRVCMGPLMTLHGLTKKKKNHKGVSNKT